MSKRMKYLGQFVLALGLLVVAVVWIAYTSRTTRVTCQRAADGRVNCAENERIGAQQMWSASVNNVKLTRRANPQDDTQGAVLLETANGETQPLTSGWISESNERVIADRIHQFIYVHQKDSMLTFELESYQTLDDWLIPGGLALAMLIFALVTLFRMMTG